MNIRNHMRRLLAALLSLAMTASVVFAASADDVLPTVSLERLNNEVLGCTVLILTYPPLYNDAGETASVSLVYTDAEEREQTVVFTQDDLRMECYAAGDTICPQLFIRLPGYVSDWSRDIPKDAVLTVGEGVFRSASGENSPPLCSALDAFDYTYFLAGADTDKITYSDAVIEGAQLRTRIADDPVFCEVWEQNCRRYWDAEPAQSVISADGKGTHTVRMELNDFVFDDFDVRVVSLLSAKTAQTWLGLKGTLLYTARTILCLPLILIPFIGPIGELQNCSHVWDYLKIFFTNLFVTELQEGTIW